MLCADAINRLSELRDVFFVTYQCKDPDGEEG